METIFGQQTVAHVGTWWIVAGVGFCCAQTALIIGLWVTMTRRREAEATMALIADLSSKFINLSPGEVDREILDAQRRVCEVLNLDLSTLWQWAPENPGEIILTHADRPLGGPPTPERMEAQAYFPWCLSELRAGRVIALGSVEDAPFEAARDREGWHHYGIKSVLTFPLSTGGGSLMGALGFNAMRGEREWSRELVDKLQIVAQIFANALARKRADQDLRESEARLSLAADSAEAGLWELDCRRRHFWATERARSIFGFDSREEITMERFEGAVVKQDLGKIRASIQRALEKREPINVEYRIRHGTAGMRWIVSRGRPFFNSNGEPERLLGTSIDITERKRAEGALRDLSGQLITAHEQERARLARELHDDITQRLARLAIDVGQCEQGKTGVSAQETAREVRKGLVQLSEDVHALSYRLHPSILEDLGLEEALRVEIDRFQKQESTDARLNSTGLPAAIPREAALCLFRVAQESLRNVARHAGARLVELSLRVLDGGLQLAVQDDGCGFDPALDHHQPSLGLSSMKERVLMVEGELEIESAPGHGTTVLAWVPLEQSGLQTKHGAP